jgi:hypothetical protein
MSQWDTSRNRATRGRSHSLIDRSSFFSRHSNGRPERNVGRTNVRGALRDDLTALLTPAGSPPLAVADRLVQALCSTGRPESIHTWKRNPTDQRALVDIDSGAITLDHDDCDAAQLGRAGGQLRELLIQHGMLPPRDPDLALFEAWLRKRLDSIENLVVR